MSRNRPRIPGSVPGATVRAPRRALRRDRDPPPDDFPEPEVLQLRVRLLLRLPEWRKLQLWRKLLILPTGAAPAGTPTAAAGGLP